VETFELASGDAVLIPAGVAHGFLALEPLQLAYLVTTEYDGTDEHGFAWDDPAVAIPWPNPAPVLSDRDRGNPVLAEALGIARGAAGGPQGGQTSAR
jgi:dTDP-4-dehydrorhamnose 3,5-epimerase